MTVSGFRLIPLMLLMLRGALFASGEGAVVKGVPPPTPPIPENRVVITVAEGLKSYEHWPEAGEALPEPVMHWTTEAFLLPRLPARFDDWGIRSRWNAPLHLVMAADIALPPGKQRLLLRARGLGRLWVDGELVATTKADTTRQQSAGGKNPLFLHPPPLPGLRPVEDYMQEVFAEATIADKGQSGARGTSRVVLELVVGGKGIRTQTGETLVAMLTPDGRSYHLLQPGERPPLSLTDQAVKAANARSEASMHAFDDANRHAAARHVDPFWKARHAIAQRWAQEHPGPAVPKFAGKDFSHPVDAFLHVKIAEASAPNASASDEHAQLFHEKIQPLLEQNCFRCHGKKAKGGLKLNTRAAALRAGESGNPAIVPGKPEASEVMARVTSDDEDFVMPPGDDPLSKEQARLLEEWIRAGAVWPAAKRQAARIEYAPLLDDAAFLRRVSLDLIGLPPSADEVAAFLHDKTADKRRRVIDRLLDDERLADHWVSLWLDQLAENPTLINAAVNSTGPFRWFLHDALRDRKPLDRMVTELLMMRGNIAEGGSIGFSLAGENDAPFAEKSHIVGASFLGIEMQCARCHDAPYHSSTQRDLFALAAMLQRKPGTVPATSRVPAAFFEKNLRASVIKVTLKPDEKVEPQWPFADETRLSDDASIDRLMMDPTDSRERLAALVTAPGNQRFAKVIVNRVWKNLMGSGFVEPVNDWEGKEASHPELLDWLARDFIAHGFNFRHLLRQIVTSRAYQRQALGNNLAASAPERFFPAPDRRRLSAEQIIDALHAVTGTPMEVEELTFDPQGRWPSDLRISLGVPARAWMMADLKNERDRPSLSLPKARAVSDVMEAFGWTGARQKPVAQRDGEPNVLQPGVLANSVLTASLSRASAGSTLAELAVKAPSPKELTEQLFLRILNRPPLPAELETYTSELANGFEQRLRPPDPRQSLPQPKRLPLVTWLNHVDPEANNIQEEIERRVRQGPPADPRLESQWRAAYEDAVWSLINHREFVWLP